MGSESNYPGYSSIHDTIECQYIICYVVLAYDKLVITLLCELNLIYTDYIPPEINQSITILIITWTSIEFKVSRF